MLFTRLLVGIVLCFSLVSCSLAPKYERPQFVMPKEWKNVNPGTAPLNTNWWVRFRDPALVALIEEALAKNQDLAKSLANIRSAAAQAGVGSSVFFPQVSGSAEAQGQLASNRTANGPPAAAPGFPY